MYICGIFGANDRVLVKTYKIFTKKESVREWINKNGYRMHETNEERNTLSHAEFLALVSRRTAYHLSIHEVENDDLYAVSRKINPKEFYDN